MIAFLILLVFTVFTHGLILFRKGLYWDGWSADSWRSRKAWDKMEQFFTEVGMPIFYRYHRFLGSFPNPQNAYNFLCLMCLLVQSYCVYLILLSTSFFSHGDAIMISILFLTLPLVQAYMDIAVIPQYVLTKTFYLIGMTIVYGSYPDSDMSYIPLKLLVIVLFWLSFYCNSILLYHFYFLGAYCFLSSLKDGWNLKPFFLNLDLFCLPFLFWIWKEKMTPRKGLYLNYNKPKLDPFTIVYGGGILLRESILAALTDPIRWMIKRGWATILILIVCVGLLELTFPQSISSPWVWIGFGLGGLFFASFPYLVVGRVFMRHGVFTRFALLLPFPLALFTWGIIRSIEKTLFSNSPSFSFAIGGSLAITCSLYYIFIYLHWIAHEAKYCAIIEILKMEKDEKMNSIFYIHDEVQIPYVTNESAAFVWSYIFEKAWGEIRWFGICEKRQEKYPEKKIKEIIDETTLGYDFTDISSSGFQKKLLVTPGARFEKGFIWSSFVVIAAQYLYRRIQGKETSEFLKSLVRIKFEEL